MKLNWNSIQWGKYGNNEYQYFFMWKPLRLEKGYRHFGRKWFFYDQPFCSFGFWFWSICWSTYWTSWKKELE